MDVAQLEKLIAENRNEKKYWKQAKYFYGENPEIFCNPPEGEPDNRIPIPLARRAVLLTKGYMAKPGNITVETDDPELLRIFDENDEQLTTANELEKTLIHGLVYELHWTENNTPMFELLPISQCIPILSSHLRPKLLGFIWHRKSGDIEYATAYDDKVYQEFKKQDGKWTFDEPKPHFYGRVPVNIGWIDSDKRNLFDHVLPMVDTLDKIVSQDYANELQKLANSYLAMRDTLGDEADENGVLPIDRIKNNKLFDGLNEDIRSAIGFIERNINGSFIAEASDRIERWIYEMMMMINPNSTDFSGESGNAQAYKLLAFEYLCANIEAYFLRFLYNRLRLISGVLKNLTGKPIKDLEKIQITCRRNLPFDLQTYANIAAQLKGQWDLKAILNLFPDNLLSQESKKRILDAEAEQMSIPPLDESNGQPVQ